MKNLAKCFLLLLASLLVLYPANALASHTITGAEYFIDKDPGEGLGSPIQAKDGAFDSDAEGLNFTVTTSNLTVGPHLLFIRMKNEEGVWGIPNKHLFMVSGAKAILAAEYFIDTDPGEGKGTPIDPKDGNFNEEIEPVALTAIDTSDLTVGIHKLYIRMKNSEGAWGVPRQYTFEITPSASNTGVITDAEFYIDTDPGVGMGFPMHASDGAFDYFIENLYAQYDTSALGVGKHTAYVRAKNADGKWTQPSKHEDFIITDITEILSVSAKQGFSGEAPFSSQLTAKIDGKTADYFMWDILSDGSIDALTKDNIHKITFDKPGTYPIKCIVQVFGGERFETTIQIKVLPSSEIEESIRFVPFYPNSDDIQSSVMQGGKVFRWYRIFSETNDTPIKDVELNYIMLKNGGQASDFKGTVIIDDYGFAGIYTPQVFAGGHFELIATDKNFDPLAVKVISPPSFNVTVEPRSFSEIYSFLIGLGVSVGTGGPGFNAGPLEFKTLKAGVYGEKKAATELIINTAGDEADIEIVNIASTEGGVESFAGIGGSIFKEYINKNGRPKLEAGISASAAIGSAMTTRHRFENFTDNLRPNHDAQLFAAAGLFFENLLLTNPGTMNNAAVREIIHAIINKIANTNEYYYSVGFSSSVKTNISAGAELSYKNPMGVSDGSSTGISLKGFDGDYLYERTDEETIDGFSRTTQEVAANIDIGAFSVDLTQKFGGDKRRKDTPEFSMDLFGATLLKVEGENSISYEKGPAGDSFTFKTVTGSEGDQFYFPGSYTREGQLLLKTANQAAVSSVTGRSDLANQMVFGDYWELSTLAYFDAYNAFLTVEEGAIQWHSLEKDISILSIPIEFGGSLGLALGLQFKINLESSIQYITCRGLILPEKGMIYTEQYEKDSLIEDNIRGYRTVTDEYKQVINDIVEELLEPVTAVKEAAKELVVKTNEKIAEGGAMIKAGVEDLLDGMKITISKIFSLGNRSYRVRASKRSNGEVFSAATVGDIFVVTAEAPDGTLIQEFLNPLELTIGFTEEDLDVAGYTATDVDKLNVYRWNNDTHYYTFIGGTIDADNLKVTTEISFPGQYLLAIDDRAPRITGFSISDGTPTPTVIFSIQDDLSGLNLSNFSVEIDGASIVDSSNVFDHLDPSTGAFKWQAESPLAEGDHSLTVKIMDSAGNSDVHTFPFNIDSTPPVLIHEPVTSAEGGKPIEIGVSASDNNALGTVSLLYRPKTNEQPYRVIQMSSTGDNQYFTDIPATDVTGFGVRYYVKAVDIAGNEFTTTPVDIAVMDKFAPDIHGGFSVELTIEGMKLSWDSAGVADIEGYRVYAGASPENFEYEENVGLSSFVFLDDDLIGSYASIAAFDAFGNEGKRSEPIHLSPCFPGDVDCNNGIDLKDAIMALKIVSSIVLDEYPVKVADINGDQVIGLAEAINALQHAANL